MRDLPFTENISSPSENPRFPQRVYINFDPRYTSLILTVPNLHVDLAENVTLIPDPNKTSVTIQTNGRYEKKPYYPDDDPNALKTVDFNTPVTIENLCWGNRNILGQTIIERRKELLEEFFIERLEGEENLKQVREILEACGLQEKSHLYRAIRPDELHFLISESALYVSPADPSANFEMESTFTSEHSQTRRYAGQSKDFDGKPAPIIRWTIEHPLLYRPAGSPVVPKVAPSFAHYLPSDLEISFDVGKTFIPFDKYTEQQSSAV